MPIRLFDAGVKRLAGFGKQTIALFLMTLDDWAVNYFDHYSIRVRCNDQYVTGVLLGLTDKIGRPNVRCRG